MHRIPPELKVTIPEDRVAQYPADCRSDSRLLVVDRRTKSVVHTGHFSDIIDFIGGDVLVLNETRVLPVRVAGFKPGGGAVELLFTKVDAIMSGDEAEALIMPSRRLRPGMPISLSSGATIVLKEKSGGRWRGIWSARANSTESLLAWLEQHGDQPLPPYIRRQPELLDRERYQTVYARNQGSLAAPTAGLHFTPELLRELENKGSQIEKITLDVGLGTFKPIRGDDLDSHVMEVESYRIPDSTALSLAEAKKMGRAVTCVGTTVVRTLESAAGQDGAIQSGAGAASLFIKPGYQFRVVDRLLTNFHRPDSTLMQLVAALLGWDLLNLSYKTALDEGFRFYSYGDAMLVL